jgi:hypothetical protein
LAFDHLVATSHVSAQIALIVLCGADFFGVHESGNRVKARNALSMLAAKPGHSEKPFSHL